MGAWLDNCGKQLRPQLANATDRHAGVWRASFAVAPDFAYDLFMTPSANTP
jgi:hypothetical protein